MQLLKGKDLAAKIKEQIINDTEEIQKSFGVSPKLVAVLASDDSGARIYAESQKKTAESLGIDYELLEIDPKISQKQMEAVIRGLNQKDAVTGVILQMPMPKHLEVDQIINTLDPKKDIEGIHPDNLGRLVLRKARVIPCTPWAAMELIESTGVNLRGLEAVVIGASQIVGTPMALLLSERSCTTTIVRSSAFEKKTLEGHVRRAEVLVVAVGKPNVIPGDWIKQGAIVIDIGINRVDGKVVGDVDFENAQKKASYITPVPGGVGPLTVTILMQNVIRAFRWQKETVSLEP